MVPRRLSGSGDSFAGYRARLVEALRAKGIGDLAVLKAFAETPRHLFVPKAVRHRAYEDVALPIGNDQTISQPFTQARYLEALGLRGKERVECEARCIRVGYQMRKVQRHWSGA